MIHFILYSRSYCHLCDDMLEALKQRLGSQLFDLDVIDIDLDDQLVMKYDELVPVLIGIKAGAMPVEICHYFLDEAKLNTFLASL